MTIEGPVPRASGPLARSPSTRTGGRLTMTGGHLLAMTPNVVATLLQSWISGTMFCVVYTLNLRRLAP